MGFVDDTHKFESRYNDWLVGPWPEAARAVARALADELSPTSIRAPVIILQGLEDAVVPPSQSEIVVEALRENGVPFAYLAFEGEQHGFRKAENAPARGRGRARRSTPRSSASSPPATSSPSQIERPD